MTLAQLNAKISTLPFRPAHDTSQIEGLYRDEARVIRDTRLGILGVLEGMEPEEWQVNLINDEIWPPAAQKEMFLNHWP